MRPFKSCYFSFAYHFQMMFHLPWGVGSPLEILLIYNILMGCQIANVGLFCRLTFFFFSFSFGRWLLSFLERITFYRKGERRRKKENSCTRAYHVRIVVRSVILNDNKKKNLLKLYWSNVSDLLSSWCLAYY